MNTTLAITEQAAGLLLMSAQLRARNARELAAAATRSGQDGLARRYNRLVVHYTIVARELIDVMRAAMVAGEMAALALEWDAYLSGSGIWPGYFHWEFIEAGILPYEAMESASQAA